MQQQVQGAPAGVQLMGSIDTLLADESLELRIRVVNIVISLDENACAGLMALAEATRKGFLLQRAREQAAGAAVGGDAGQSTDYKKFKNAVAKWVFENVAHSTFLWGEEAAEQHPRKLAKKVA